MKKGKNDKSISSLFARYLLIIAAGLALPLFYKVLTPLTLLFLKLIYEIPYDHVTIFGSMLRLPHLIIEIVPACVAGAAFYLLLILILSIPNITLRKRFHMLTAAFTALFILNILRILILVAISGSAYFETIHWIVWHLISTLFVVTIWVALVRKYKISKIPIYSDAKNLFKAVQN